MIVKSNGGLLSARNAGVRASVGEFIQFLDQDDVLHRHKLRLAIEFARKEHVDVAASGFKQFRDLDEIDLGSDSCPVTSTWMSRRAADLNQPYLVPAFWGCFSPVFRRHVVESAGPFPEELAIAAAEESEFHSRIKLLRPRIGYFDEVLAFHRVTPGSITHDSFKTYRSCAIAAGVVGEMMLRAGVRDRLEWQFLMKDCARRVWGAMRYHRDAQLLRDAARAFAIALEGWMAEQSLL